MKSDVFKRFDDWQKQKDIAIFFIARLKSSREASLPTYDYASSLALARIISQNDTERLVKVINVYGHYVTIERNEKGCFAFAPVTLDHHERNFFNQTDDKRP